ncbi:hypothetical protein RB195_019645 [Necator americanus]|uniref:Uncharacterized protein n=1 Tax=Necator americanus TaxID=51031 RepID=A0ABR1CF59_NECAM
MERELRLKAFIEEYARVVQLFDDIVSMKESMGRLETYMVIMVCQVGVAMIALIDKFSGDAEPYRTQYFPFTRSCGTWWSAELTSLANEGDEALEGIGH